MTLRQRIDNIRTQNYFMELDALHSRRLEIIQNLDWVSIKEEMKLRKELKEIQSKIDNLKAEKKNEKRS